MQLILRNPDKGYLDSWLWLPKKHISEPQIKGALTYVGRNNELVEGFKDEKHHVRVPRNFYPPAVLSDLPYEVVDSRIRSFPRVVLNSRITLDLKEPTKTYQRDGSAALLNVQDGILCLRCGAGKTLTALHTAAQLQVPILIVVGDKGLAKQWVDAIQQFLDVPIDHIGRIGGDGSPFDWEHPICVAIVNSLAIRATENRLPPELIAHFGVVIADEAHTMAAPFFNRAIPPFHGRRWGLSATPTRDDGFDSLLQYTLGNVVYKYLMPDLRPKVVFRKLPTNLNMDDPYTVERTHDVSGAFHFGKTYDYFGTDRDQRTDTIAAEIQAALDSGRNILVLTHSRSMIDALERRFPTAGICHGGVGEAQRIQRIKNCNPVIAIMRLGKQALDKPALDTLFVCEPIQKPQMLQQTMGRVLRHMDGKKEPMVIFFEDEKIKPLRLMCNKIRRTLNRWPEEKGGRIPYTIK